MKLIKDGTSELVAEEDDRRDDARVLLFEGDQVLCTITKQIRIDGMDNWVKYGVVTTIRTNETSEEAEERVSLATQEGLMRQVFTAVETERKYKQ